MIYLRPILLALVGAASAALGADAFAANVVVELPPLGQPAMSEAADDWCRQADTVTHGRLTCATSHTGASSPDVLTALKAGTLGLAVIAHQDYPQAFAVSRIAELPRLGDFAETVSAAYQRTFVATSAMSAEHRGLKVLAVFTQSPSYFFFSSGRMDTVNQLQSKSVAVLRPSDGAVATALGTRVAAPGSPIDVSGMARISTASEVLRSGGAPGLRTAAMLAGGLSNVSYAFAMNEKLWGSLSPEDRQAVDRISGEQLARSFGRRLDAAEWKANMKERGDGVVFYSPDDALAAQLEQRLKSVDRPWLAAARQSHVLRPDKVLAQFRQAITTLELAE